MAAAVAWLGAGGVGAGPGPGETSCGCVESAAGCWFSCCRWTFCMCHFCEEVWNLVVGFHTTALCTTGTVSLGSRGRCFFSVGVGVGVGVGVAGTEGGAAVRVAVDKGAALMTTGEVAGRGTMVTGMASGEGWGAALEEVEGAAGLWERATGTGWTLPTWEEISAEKVCLGRTPKTSYFCTFNVFFYK